MVNVRTNYAQSAAIKNDKRGDANDDSDDSDDSDDRPIFTELCSDYAAVSGTKSGTNKHS